MKHQINIADIPSTSLIIKDYLNKNKSLSNFYHRDFSKENLLEQSREKLSNYNFRETLVSELSKQLQGLDLTNLQKKNLENLSLENTVTITTGHQLNLMTGPLYFIYKILHTIKLCNSMNDEQKEIHFVPIFWMATEDHDFEEINHFTFENKTIQWTGNYKDFVGELPVNELKNVLSSFYEELKYFPEGKKLRKIIDKSYFSQTNLATATRNLVHELFKDFGLLIIDGNSKQLKQIFTPYIKEDILNQSSYHSVNNTIRNLQKNYKIQVNPREINFFYHNHNNRNRIEKINNTYAILDSDVKFSQEEIVIELESHPEKFSPNALMRPVYQEVILPNAAYIGGNAEIAYWLELKEYFDIQKIPFPILIPRNSFLLMNENQTKKIEKFQLEYTDILKPKEQIINYIIKNIPDISFDFNSYEKRLNNIFEDLLKESQQTDPVWKNMILAQQQKQTNGLQKINHRFNKAQKLKHKEFISNFEDLYSQLFPNDSWQERKENLSYYYRISGEKFLNLIYNNISEYKSTINFINI